MKRCKCPIPGCIRLILLLLTASVCFTAALADDAAVWRLPHKADELSGEAIPIRTRFVSQVTGERSANRTLSRFKVWGVDLGSMTEMNGKVYMFGGDTFDSARMTDWRSNTLFVIEDDDPSDGLTIIDAITDETGRAKELLVSAKIDNLQMTVIPTNIFAVGDTLYCIYMSVKHWDEQGGVWTCGFSGLAKSTNEGESWTKLNGVKWPGDSNFIQTAHCQVEDTLYFWGIPAGRYGGVALMKVKADQVEDFEAWSYFTGVDGDGQPQWVQGSSGIYQAKVIIEGPVGEISAMYNEYLGNFVLTYLKEPTVGIMLREGVTPWGAWSKEHVLVPYDAYHIPYGAFMLPRYVEENGRIFYFAMSQFHPIYNIMWIRAELPRNIRD